MKTINLDLTTVDGNAYMILAAFEGQAKREGWDKELIESIMVEAKSGDYDHLLKTIIDCCEAVE